MSNQDEKLYSLLQTEVPAPSAAAKRRALDAAMLAFDAEQESQKKAAQGNPLAGRLRSIFQDWKGKWTMDTRLSYGLGTAAVALLLLPLGYQLYSTTAITPPNGVVVTSAEKAITSATTPEPVVAPRDEAADLTPPLPYAGGEQQAAAKPAADADANANANANAPWRCRCWPRRRLR